MRKLTGKKGKGTGSNYIRISKHKRINLEQDDRSSANLSDIGMEYSKSLENYYSAYVF